MPMFHVEHMKMPLYLLFFVILSILGCNRPDSNAYKLDPILQDYQSQLASTIAESESVTKQRLDVEKELKESLPQTGQASIHRKRIADMSNRISQLDQQIRFWKIRIESRAKEAQAEYLTAREKNQPWPDPKAVDSYYAQKRLRLSKLAWDNKDRLAKSKEPQKEKEPEQAP